MNDVSACIQWGKFLNEAHETFLGAKSSVRLPNGITISGAPGLIQIHLTEACVTSNMQTDQAAFEAWSLALMAWCGVEKIRLSWDEPSPTGAERKHYERFLFRVHNFHSWFAPRFSVETDVSLQEKARCLDETLDLRLNVAGNRRKILPSDIEPNSEADWEKKLLTSDEFKKKFGLEIVDRQFPVGLFIGQPARDKNGSATEVFTGGKSAIDLVGISKDQTLWLFELKKKDNVSMGILSELLFYVGVMQEVLSPKKHFKFADAKPGRHVTIGPDEVKGCKRIEACLLSDEHHPLLKESKEHNESRILKLLNATMAACAVPVHFRMERVTGGNN